MREIELTEIENSGNTKETYTFFCKNARGCGAEVGEERMEDEKMRRGGLRGGEVGGLVSRRLCSQPPQSCFGRRVPGLSDW